MGNSMVYYPTYQTMMRKVRFAKGRQLPLPPSRFDLMCEVVAAIRSERNDDRIMQEINNRASMMRRRHK